MDQVRLGSTGLEVSRICLGCMSYGESDRGGHAWTLDEEASRPFINKALELGITFFDTANVYSNGSSEEILGRAVRDFANRDDLVLATKVHGRMRNGSNAGGLSRKVILREIDDSLRRLDTDYVDLYQVLSRVGDASAFRSCPWRKSVGVAMCDAHDVLHSDSAHRKGVSDEGAVAAPRYGFGAHQGNMPFLGQIGQPFHIFRELIGLHVVRVAAKRRIAPGHVG